jgi:hypothetical protein
MKRGEQPKGQKVTGASTIITPRRYVPMLMPVDQ